MRTDCSIALRVGITTSRSTSLSSCGVPQAYEPNRMIFAGRNRSAIRRAKRLMADNGIFGDG
jgi:hypothetical protein